MLPRHGVLGCDFGNRLTSLKSFEVLLQNAENLSELLAIGRSKCLLLQ
jgi:hypothetical protein